MTPVLLSRGLDLGPKLGPNRAIRDITGWTGLTSDAPEYAGKLYGMDETAQGITAPFVFQDRCLKPLGHPSVSGEIRHLPEPDSERNAIAAGFGVDPGFRQASLLVPAMLFRLGCGAG
jgi:hypothetical protein